MTKFADMTPAARRQALAWARSHDWGDGAIMLDSPWLPVGILVRIPAAEQADEMAGGHCHPDMRTSPDGALFTSMQTLRDWAGY